MNPLDYTKAFTNFWTAQGDALKKAQEQAGKALGRGHASPGVRRNAENAGLADRPFGRRCRTDARRTVHDGTVVCRHGDVRQACHEFPATAGTVDATVEATFRKIADPRSWLAGTGEMDDVLGRMAEGPRFADLWEIERLYARVLQAWMNSAPAGPRA